MLMRSGKPVVLAVNKVDKVRAPRAGASTTYSLGLGEVFRCPDVGHGTGDLLDAVCSHLKPAEDGRKRTTGSAWR